MTGPSNATGLGGMPQSALCTKKKKPQQRTVAAFFGQGRKRINASRIAYGDGRRADQPFYVPLHGHRA